MVNKDNNSSSERSRSNSESSRSPSHSPASRKSRSPLSNHSNDDKMSVSRSGSESPKDRKDKSNEEEEEEENSGDEKRNDEQNYKKKESRGEKDSKKEVQNVGREDIFGDNLSISSEDDDDKNSKEALLSGEGDNDDEEEEEDDDDNVQRYDDDNDKAHHTSDTDGKTKKSKQGKSQESMNIDKDEEFVPETRIDVEVPKITTNLGKEIHFVKLPNFLSVDSRPFDPESYEDEIEDEDSLDEEGRARLKLKVENTIRWKQEFDSDGKAVKQSNARFVKWSDGSMSLHLGSEIFDVYKQPLVGDFNHLFIRQGTGLQGQAVFRTKISFRPHSTESFTHQKMTRSMADRSNKATGIKVISQVGKNPEIGRWKRMKEEEEKLRASMRRDSKQRRIKDRSFTKGIGSGFLEDASDEEGVSLSAIKNKYKKNKKDNKPIYTSDEDSDVETSRTNRSEKTKTAIHDSDEESNHSSSKASQSEVSEKANSASEEDEDSN